MASKVTPAEMKSTLMATLKVNLSEGELMSICSQVWHVEYQNFKSLRFALNNTANDCCLWSIVC